MRELEYLNRVHEAPPLLECKPSILPPVMTSYDFSQEDNVGRSFFPRIPSVLTKAGKVCCFQWRMEKRKGSKVTPNTEINTRDNSAASFERLR